MTPSKKLRSIAASTGLDGIADAIREIAEEIEHNNAPAVPQGWKLVPVEPTRAMWAAVNKLDDEMAAGSYDGKGCSIEQAWNCMLDFAPDAPALAATPAPAPAQEVPSDPNGWCQYVAGMVFGWLQMQEGLGLTSYDEDRFVEAIARIFQRRLWAYKPAQEPSACGLCQGSGVLSPTQKCICQYGGKEPAQEVGLTDDEIKQACTDIYLSDHPQGSESYDIALGRAVIAALRAKGASDAEPCTRDQARAAIAKATGATHEQ